MAKGGYQIIDFKGAVIGSTAITVPGAFEKATQGKAILFENVKQDASIPALSMFTYGLQAYEDGVYCLGVTMTSDGPAVVIVAITDEDAVTATTYAIAEAE